MSYIGNPIVSTDFPVDYKSGNGSTTAFTLSVAPASVNSIDVQISGVSQSPQTYYVSGTTLTFSAAPPTGTNNIVVRHIGIAGIPNVPSAGSVIPSSIGTGYALWNLSGSDVNYTAGNVGIGTSSPSANLQVNGSNIRLQGDNSYYSIASTAGSRYGYLQGTSSGLILTADGATYLRFDTNSAERMRIDSSGRVLVGLTSANTSGSNLQVSQGITFPATQLASTDANTLDDYEEGTWTPSAIAGIGTITAQSGSGKYTKIGNIVTASFSVTVSSGTISAISFVAGLPFTNGTVSSCGAGRESAVTGNMWELEVGSGATAISPHRYDNSHAFSAGYTLFGTVTYLT